MTKSNGKSNKGNSSKRARMARRTLAARMLAATEGQFHVLGSRKVPEDAVVAILVVDAKPDHVIGFGPFDGIDEAKALLPTVARLYAEHYGEDAAKVQAAVGWTRRTDFPSPLPVGLIRRAASENLSLKDIEQDRVNDLAEMLGIGQSDSDEGDEPMADGPDGASLDCDDDDFPQSPEDARV